MSDWKPIETAPKKGPILVYFKGLIYIVQRPAMSFAKGPTPTHWMPLPEPPKASA